MIPRVFILVEIFFAKVAPAFDLKNEARQSIFAPNFFKKLMSKKISRELLEILVCPLCKGDLIYDEQRSELICSESKLAYPIRDGIPVMLVEEARKI